LPGCVFAKDFLDTNDLENNQQQWTLSLTAGKIRVVRKIVPTLSDTYFQFENVERCKYFKANYFLIERYTYFRFSRNLLSLFLALAGVSSDEIVSTPVLPRLPSSLPTGVCAV